MSRTASWKCSRRRFLKHAGGAAAASALAAAGNTHVHAAEDNTINIALVGCGGRGAGAVANALVTTTGPTKLVAMADVFEDRLASSLQALSERFGDQVDVPPERRFLGFGAYKNAIDCLGKSGVVILATPPAFRPGHFEYAVDRGQHVFMEKSFAVDAPGVRRVLKAGDVATGKNLKVGGGLMSRHCTLLQDAIRRIHEGIIGEVITCWAYRVHGSVGYKPRVAGMSEMAHQIRNYSNFTWLNGSFLLDWLIHNLDVCCWVKDAWPVSAQGQGGRRVRIEPDQLFDHYAAEYSFADGTRLFAQGRHMDGCWGFFGDVIHGATGMAVLGEGIPKPRIYEGHKQTPENLIWEPTEPRPNPYDVEHEALFEAIRQDRPHNETERCAYAALTGILGRMAVESGREVTWEEALASELVLAPGLDDITMDSDPPVTPDADGHYPVAKPGITKAL